MGIKLMVEVLDHWQDAGLTAGEKSDLLVIAEHASDDTRKTVVSIHKPYMLKRAGKSAASWRTAIHRLMKKGALEHAAEDGRRVTGHKGRVAQYRIPHLCPTRSHDGLWGQCTRAERVTSQMTHSEGEVNQEGHLSDDPLDQEGHLTDTRGSSDRYGKGHLTDDPSPSSLPQDPSSLSVAEQVVKAAAVVTDAERETFINWIKDKHQPRGNAWWRTVARNGDLPGLAEDWRAQHTPATAPAATLPPWCEQCGDDNPAARLNPRFRTLDDGRPCPTCHPDARKAAP